MLGKSEGFTDGKWEGTREGRKLGSRVGWPDGNGGMEGNMVGP